MRPKTPTKSVCLLLVFDRIGFLFLFVAVNEQCNSRRSSSQQQRRIVPQLNPFDIFTYSHRFISYVFYLFVCVCYWCMELKHMDLNTCGFIFFNAVSVSKMVEEKWGPRAPYRRHKLLNWKWTVKIDISLFYYCLTNFVSIYFLLVWAVSVWWHMTSRIERMGVWGGGTSRLSSNTFVQFCLVDLFFLFRTERAIERIEEKPNHFRSRKLFYLFHLVGPLFYCNIP